MKNWTVITQPVRWQSKGLYLRERYLTSVNHSNHRNTESIIDIIGDSSSVKRIALMGEHFNLKRNVSNSRGRRLESYAMEFCLTLPKGFRPAPEEWTQVVNDICFYTRQYCKLTPEESKRFDLSVRAVLHRQDPKTKLGAGDHIHLILPKVVRDGDKLRILKELQRKQYTKIVKSIYTSSVLRNFGYEINNYSPKATNSGRKLEIWKANREKLEIDISRNNELLRIVNQMKKWFIAFETNDNKQKNRQFNRIKKSYLDYILDNDAKLPDSVIKNLNTIETLSNKKLIV
ncbi:hypothetical protein L1D26_22470 [Vibrio mediterranei]|uniref:hypothetical protein n=1 Tax=Vibrio mediterranei TaxID=689 RepID=UPI001EFC49F6|nr:hypothetical protein [Vibrio mediterranei]MCG9665818.1 hypothetical protein [Vibrio mediterranei]